MASFPTRNSDVSSSKCNWSLLQGFVSPVCPYIEEREVILNSSETSSENRAICIETSIYRGRKAPFKAACSVVHLGWDTLRCAQPKNELELVEQVHGLHIICHLAWKYL